MEGMKNVYSIYSECLEKSDRLGNIGKNGGILLKCITIDLTRIGCGVVDWF
jgi:hypothetical protein